MKQSHSDFDAYPVRALQVDFGTVVVVSTLK